MVAQRQPKPLNKMVGSLDQIQADQGGPRSRKTCRVTHFQLQEPKTNVPSVSKSMESHRVKLGGKQLLTIGGSWQRSLAYVFDALREATGLDVVY